MDLDEIKKGMNDSLLLLKEKLKNSKYRIDRIDDKIKEQQKFREQEVVELDEIKDLIKRFWMLVLSANLEITAGLFRFLTVSP